HALYDEMGTDSPTAEQIQNYEPKADSLVLTKQILLSIMKEGESPADIVNDLEEGVKEISADAEYHFNPDYNPRDIVGDNYDNASERYYGNNDVGGPDPMHGTHVSGIIGADRSNNIGIKGIADNVRILAVRCVPDGDERDKDVANAIRYAVDQGAKVI